MKTAEEVRKEMCASFRQGVLAQIETASKSFRLRTTVLESWAFTKEFKQELRKKGFILESDGLYCEILWHPKGEKGVK